LQTGRVALGLGSGLSTGGQADKRTDGRTDICFLEIGTEDSDWAAVVVVIYGSFALRLQHQQQTEKLVKK